MVRSFPHSEYLSVFSPNAGKCGPEKNFVFGDFSRCVFSQKSSISDDWQRSKYVSDFGQELLFVSLCHT